MPFDINGGELIVLGAVAVVVLGPERLPTYAAQLGRLVRETRSFAKNAREQVRSEMGDEFDDIDWQALDPRRYDPRRIVRDALLDDEDDEPRVSDRAPHVPAAMRPADDRGGSTAFVDDRGGSTAFIDDRGAQDDPDADDLDVDDSDADKPAAPGEGAHKLSSDAPLSPVVPPAGTATYDADAT